MNQTGRTGRRRRSQRPAHSVSDRAGTSWRNRRHPQCVPAPRQGCSCHCVKEREHADLDDEILPCLYDDPIEAETLLEKKRCCTFQVLLKIQKQ